MSAIEVWKQRVVAHQAQSRQAQAAMGRIVGDRWEVASPFFKANPLRLDDVEVNRLAREVNPSTTVLDVGGGAGRFALPLALRCRHSSRTVTPHASEFAADRRGGRYRQSHHGGGAVGRR